MNLWPHQSSALSQSRECFKRGEKAWCLVAPCGAGKSKIMQEIAIPASNNDKHVCLYTHRIMLTRQTINAFERTGVNFGVVANGFEEYKNRDAKIQICSLDTVFSRMGNWRHEFPRADIVIVDEAHQQVAAKAQAVFGRHEKEGARRIGFTATPVELGAMYQSLVCAGTYSDMLACKAHLPIKCYGPDRPDLSSVKTMKGGDFSQETDRKINRVPTIIGRVYEYWQKLNPDALPAIGFAPGVAESKWFVNEFKTRGVPCAHIDAERVVIVEKNHNGILEEKEYRTDDSSREAILEGSKDGRFKILWNRFILREAIDCPWLYHAIAATSMGSVSTYMQSIGRVMRYWPHYEHVCVSRGTLILTDRGEVPIESVRLDDMVWDGVEFVSHDGAVCNGNQRAIEWCGLTATPGHKVLTEHGWSTIEEAKISGRRIVVGGVCGQEVRVLDDSNPYYQSREMPSRGGGLRSVYGEVNGVFSQDREEGPSRVREVHPAFRAALSRVAMEKGGSPEESMRITIGQYVSPIWCSRDSIQVPVNIRRGVLDHRESWEACVSQDDIRQDRQRWALRAWESAMGDIFAAVLQQAEVCSPWLSHPEIQGGFPGSWIQSWLYRRAVCSRHSGRGDCGNVEAVVEVWDIKNAGPRNRYTANGLIVANCLQDHGGNIDRHGTPDQDREWTLGCTNNSVHKEEVRKKQQKSGDDAEPICCPQCSSYRLSGPSCQACGYMHKRSVRMVRQLDGTLVRKTGRNVKHKAAKGFDDYLRSAIYAGWCNGLTVKQAYWIAKKKASINGVKGSASSIHTPNVGSGDWHKSCREIYPNMKPKQFENK